MLLVVIALIFLLVRFLLVATKAAQIYVAKNSPAVSSETPNPASAVPATTTPPAKAAPRPRTPKAP